MHKILSIVAIIAVFATSAFAGGKPMGPIYGSTGTVFKPGKIGVIFKYETVEMDEFYSDMHKKSYKKEQVKGAYNKEVSKYQMTLRYGVMPRFDVRFITNFVSKKLDRHMAKKTPMGMQHIYMNDDNSGLGDSAIFGRYQVMSQKAGDPFFLAVGAGIKMPTGSTSEEDNGKKLPVFLQNGSGSWDPKFEVGLSKVMGSFRLDTHMMYSFNTEGAQDTKKGNCLKYNVAGTYALNNLFDASLELRGHNQQKTEINGVKKADSGFTVHYIVPGLKVKFGRKGLFGVSMPYVIQRNTNGEQLAEKYRFQSKLSLFF